jgi:rubrerythrin
MKLLRTTGKHISIGLLLFFAPMVWAQEEPKLQEESKPASTIDNLQAAYDSHSNAHIRYLAFAQKADNEGYSGAASLCRAAARSHQVGAGNHSALLKKLGAVPAATTEQPLVRSTMENLKTALDAESYERDKIYPDFIKQAQQEGNNDAVRIFDWAAKAGAEHANFFVSALARPDQWQKAKKDFFVCSNCGRVARSMPAEKCPVCSEPQSKVEKVN